MRLPRLLNPLEVRILGCLLEKEQTTPDAYPLTVAALVAACNQKSNRDPVISASEREVKTALDALGEDVLVWRTEGARSVRYKHALDRRWDLGPETKAVVTELLLRGPQTPGELRARAERMHPFPSLDAVDEALRELADGPDPLVEELPRQPGRRETRWAHRVGDESTPASTASGAEESSGGDDRLSERVEALEERVRELAEHVQALARSLEGRP